jgi:hypothetical protein
MPGGRPPAVSPSQWSPTPAANPLDKLGERIKPQRWQGRVPFLRLFTRRDQRLGRSRRSS